MNVNKKTTGLRMFLSYYKPYRGLLVADITCAALTAAIALVLPICVRYVTNSILGTGMANAAGEIYRIGMLMLVLILAQTGFCIFYDYMGHVMGAKIERDMRQELFAHYQKLPHSFFDNQETGKLMSRLTNDLLNLAELYHHGPEDLVVYAMQFIGALFILIYVNPKLTAVICVFLPFIAIYSFIFYRRLQKSYRENRERIAQVNSCVEENLSGIRVVKSFVNESTEEAKFAIENDGFYRSRTNIYRDEALHYTVIDKLLTQLITVSIVVFGGIWIAQASLNLADLLMFILYSAYLTAPVPRLAFMVQQYQEGLSGYRRFREIVDIAPDICDASDARDIHLKEGRVEFDNVAFKYSGDGEYVLRNINLDVAPGKTCAIVGQSGVGKTTLCSLIPRFYTPAEGEIRIDGIPVQSMTLQSLRRQIGVVQQENFLFSGTVVENIMYGRPGATEAEAVKAAEKANAHGFIMALPQGYNTKVGQRGVKLSVGQKQRICIARVFLKDPPILIFDEATSALDYENERFVMESFRLLAENRTTFIITHRLGTIRDADCIAVLSGEGISEKGTHDQLIALNGEYAGIMREMVTE